MTERYERTMASIEELTRASYLVKIQWECAWDESKMVEQKPELLTHTIVQQNHLNPRNALYGGRTEAMRLY
jgi:G:T-mismatch repair DNA endonuclease (very short patch repair protein)